DVADPRPLAGVEHLGPRVAAVGRLEESPVPATPAQRTLGRDVNDIGVARVDHDLTDVLRFAQTHILPRSPAVRRSVDAIAVRNGTLRVVLSGSDPDGIRILRVDRDRTDRVRGLIVEHWRPGGPGIRRLPDTTSGNADVPDFPVAGMNGEIDDAAGDHRWADR